MLGNESQNVSFVGHDVGQGHILGSCKPLKPLFLLVGMARIELTTPASRRQCSTRLSYTPTPCYLIKLSKQIREASVRLASNEQLSRAVRLRPPEDVALAGPIARPAL